MGRTASESGAKTAGEHEEEVGGRPVGQSRHGVASEGMVWRGK